jgi:hypothetical protein
LSAATDQTSRCEACIVKATTNSITIHIHGLMAALKRAEIIIILDDKGAW